MGLDAMCESLRARCPSLTPPPTPIEECNWGEVRCSRFSIDVGDDEWAFIADLLGEDGALSFDGLSAEFSPPPSPGTCATIAYTASADPDSPNIDSFYRSGAMSATLTGPEDAQSSTGTLLANDPLSVLDGSSILETKQIRRKTVIIQVPDSVLNLDAQSRSALSRAPPDASLGLHDQPVPFEEPVVAFESCRQSTPPPGSRPVSTSSVSSTKPVRGILKQQKSVRFSAVPSLHEYHVDQDTETPAEVKVVVRSGRQSLPPAQHSPNSTPRLAPSLRRGSTPHAVQKGSPLRESYTPAHARDTSGTQGRVTAGPGAGRSDNEYTNVVDHTRGPDNLAGEVNSCSASIPPACSGAGALSPKHPARRAPINVRTSSPGAGTIAIATPTQKSPPVAGASPRQPMPPHRPPLRLVDGVGQRQNMPAGRRASAAGSVPTKTGGAVPTRNNHDGGGAKASALGTQMQKTVAGLRRRAESMPPRPRQGQDENTARRSAVGTVRVAEREVLGSTKASPKCRMVPLKSILTKLRTSST